MWKYIENLFEIKHTDFTHVSILRVYLFCMCTSLLCLSILVVNNVLFDIKDMKKKKKKITIKDCQILITQI